MPPVVTPPMLVNQTPRLENGDQLTATEFLRRYHAMPEAKKAELIDGTVYMASPVRLDRHAEPDTLAQTWLGCYMIATPGVKAGSNATVRLSADEVPQPDILLRILPGCGGQSHMDKDGYLRGAPELAFEVAASSASIDARQKLLTYRRAGVLEYVVWRTQNGALDWWKLEEDEYIPLLPDEAGIIRSETFPGLWLNVNALLAGDGATMLATLNQGTSSAEHAALLRRLAEAAAGESKA